jgi:prepilin-type N-terminal cleavage/methylation domain-containing protein/prepilin-type processing-associated H-X9-DG protein
MTRQPVNRGFSLVELLVVIGIIAILISILLPALGSAKANANRLKCASNLRTLGQVAMQYAADNRGWLPHSYYYGGGIITSGGMIGSISWVDLLARGLRSNLPSAPKNGTYDSAYDQLAAPYYSKIQWFRCPSYPNQKQPVQYLINGWGIATTNDYTLAVLKTTKVKRAGEVIYFVEANKNRPLDQFNLHDVWDPSHLPRGGAVRVIDDARHRGATNMTFVDGHVEAKPFASLKPNDFIPAR